MSLVKHWQVFTAAPHRVMFLGGMVQLTLTIFGWLLELAARYTDLWSPLPTVIFSTWAHAWLMLFSLFTFFIFGFLMTTYPRWMSGPPVPPRSYVGSFALQISGIVLYDVGLFTGHPLLVAGVTLHLFGFGLGLLALHTVYRVAGPARSRKYETHISSALLLGLVTEASYIGWLLLDNALLLEISLRGALWLFLIPMLVLVAHRMIPFFSSSALRGYMVVQPRWSFALVWLACATHFALEIVHRQQWLFLADIPLLALALHHAYRWSRLDIFANRLLAALHVAFGFFAFGMLLSVVQSLWLFATGDVVMARGPLHALTIGFVGGMVVAMVTRVSRGHSGRPMQMDRLDWYAFVAMLVVALARVAAEFEVMAQLPLSLNILAAAVWLAAISLWAVRYVPIYLQPRLDGEPG